MTVRSAMILARMALLFFLAESPFAPLLGLRYPGHVAAIVLAGAVVVAAPMGLLLARAIRAGSEDQLAERYRKTEWSYLLAAAASLAGVILTIRGRGDLGASGILLSAGGMLTALWLLLHDRPAGSRPDAASP